MLHLMKLISATEMCVFCIYEGQVVEFRKAGLCCYTVSLSFPEFLLLIMLVFMLAFVVQTEKWCYRHWSCTELSMIPTHIFIFISNM